jgi:beta-mannosidase
MKCPLRIYLLFLICFIAQSGFAASDVISLNSNWYINKNNAAELYSAQVPGSVYGDLLRNKLISDPYIGANEKTVAWVAQEEWNYIDTFLLSDEQLNRPKIELQFKGIDTHAEVYLNGQLIGETHSMFIEYNFDIKSYCRKTNIVRVLLRSTAKLDSISASKYPVKLPGGNSVHSRKAAFQSGWDFAPDLKAGGIWKAVNVVFADNWRINSLGFYTEEIKASEAAMKFTAEIHSDLQQEGKLLLKNDSMGINVEIPFALKVGSNKIVAPFVINHPKLWQLNGQGEAYLYQILCKIDLNGKNIFSEVLNAGVRTINLEQKKDSIGSSFTFVVNGKPVFMKGANVVPPDSKIGEATDSAWQFIVKNAADKRMNMLRIWGGGVYPPDAFYEECDRLGIAVWQDFMFACSMYPGDSAYMELVNEEATQAVLRLSSHPSLALWCGNNEVIEGWNNWGWQKQFNYSKADSIKIIDDYRNLFEVKLKNIVADNGYGVFYWPSSPSIGWGRKESMLSGDAHYWGVWWGMEPFSKYKEKVPRFMSEYGFQSLPSFSTLQSFYGGGLLGLENAGVQNHQKHATGFKIVGDFQKAEYNSSTTFKEYVYLSQLVQRNAMRTAINAHRSAMPRCMGSLFWQMNDCWPGISWSTTDYYGKDKAAAYEVKRLYANVINTIDLSDDKILKVHVVSDSTKFFRAQLKISVYNFTGSLMWSDVVPVNVNSSTSALAYEKSLKPYMHFIDTTNSVLVVDLIADDALIARSTELFCAAKYLKLKRPSISMKKSETTDNSFTVELVTNVFVKDAELSVNNNASGFSDNYFDLIPGERYTVTYTAPNNAGVMNGFNIHSLVDTY